MLKKILIGLGVFIALIFITFGIAAYYFLPDKNTIPDFALAHPDKSAMMLMRNGELIAAHNPDKLMTLASTMKVVVAIEYAEQAQNGSIDPNEQIPITELDLYYIPNTDGGAHPAWLNWASDKINDGKISIRDITKGMIMFSSNANTEWLIDKLGMENINKQFDKLDLNQHTPIYPIVSALLVSKEFDIGIEREELIEKLQELSQQEYIDLTLDIHQKLKSDTSYKSTLGNLAFDLQKIWSDRLPASTAADYLKIMKLINDREYFAEGTQEYLDEIMEFMLANPANRSWLKHTGSKGGSTAFVLTRCLYATEISGDKTELVYFFNDLNFVEQQRLQMSINDFELQVLTDANFREELKERFN
ncbi:serine hydrolase [Peijinzhouia sedimentorum]